MDGAVGVDEVNALGELVDFGLSGGAGVGVDLAVGVGEADVVPVDEGEGADAGAGEGFGGPGADATDADDGEVGVLNAGNLLRTVEAADTAEAVVITTGFGG